MRMTRKIFVTVRSGIAKKASFGIMELPAIEGSGGMGRFSVEVMVVFDVVILAVGLYLIYAVWRMKKTGEISELVVTRDEIKKCRDKDGFIRDICKKMAWLGILATAFGMISLLNDAWKAVGNAYVQTAVRLLFIGGCLWLSSQIRKGRERFF